ncbi:MAG: hypothetical protein WCK01_05715, partial [Candidatus Uhrbacteria bacterium]
MTLFGFQLRSFTNFLRKFCFGIILPIALFGLFASALPVSADIAHTIGYQGRLKNSAGNPLTSTFTFTFRMYDVSTGGSPVWSETQPGISTSDGFFAVRLGSVSAFPIGFDFNKPLYLSTEVNSDGEMSPRVAINSVAYAYTTEGVGSYPSAPVNATGGRMYYNTSDSGLYYYDQGATTWRLLGTATGTFQSVTNAGAVTTNAIQFAGGTSTGVFNFTTATGSSLFATNATFATATVLGQAVCLQNGIGCPLISQSDTLASVAARGSYATSTLQLYGGFIGSSSTVTSTFTVLGATNLNNLIATNATFTSLAVTGSVPTSFVNLSWTNATGTNTILSNATATWLGFSTASGSNLFATNAFFATATVAGQSVCLANGTCCPSTIEADTLASVAARGSFSATTLQLFGGFIGSSSTVTSTFTVLGATTLGTLSFTNGTATNLGVTGSVGTNLNPNQDGTLTLGTASFRWNANFASVTATSVTTTNLFGTNGTVTNLSWTNATGTNATTTNFFSTNASATNIFATNATFTNMVITGATPSSFENISWVNATGTNTILTNATTSWLGFTTASGSTIFATNATFASATIMGSAVCLQTGTNCPASSETLASVSSRGSYVTTTLQLYG